MNCSECAFLLFFGPDQHCSVRHHFQFYCAVFSASVCWTWFVLCIFNNLEVQRLSRQISKRPVVRLTRRIQPAISFSMFGCDGAPTLQLRLHTHIRRRIDVIDNTLGTDGFDVERPQPTYASHGFSPTGATRDITRKRSVNVGCVRRKRVHFNGSAKALGKPDIRRVTISTFQHGRDVPC